MAHVSQNLTGLSWSRLPRLGRLSLLTGGLYLLAGCGDDTNDQRASTQPEADGCALCTEPPEREASVGVDGAAEPSWCAACVDETAAAMADCPELRPSTGDDLDALCAAKLAAGWPQARISLGDCTPVQDMPGCLPGAPDPEVQILSVYLGLQGYDCHYARTGGTLLGKVMVTDGPTFCGNRAYAASTPAVKNAWCQAGGKAKQTVSCGG
jgi:hypothetical protein